MYVIQADYNMFLVENGLYVINGSYTGVHKRIRMHYDKRNLAFNIEGGGKCLGFQNIYKFHEVKKVFFQTTA